jgi:hypothetical protein
LRLPEQPLAFAAKSRRRGGTAPAGFERDSLYRVIVPMLFIMPIM